MIYVIIKRSALENVLNVKINCVLNVSRIITKTVNSCLYCRLKITEHSKRNRLLEDMLLGGDVT